ncbi:MAG TPA: FGGY family carbohydrate kinase [Feifaniaceae bacterium]|nr:FGGY family carbohydrate kinase [Feifaniaceae bacterium]
MSCYLAIDLGTTGCRSILFDGGLRPLSDSYIEYGLMTPREHWVEQDANLWWELALETAVRAIAASGVSGREIDAIGISSQGITIVPIDKQFEPLRNAISWLDARAEKQAAFLERVTGSQEMFRQTGKSIYAAYAACKILWIRENEPEVFQKTWKFVMPMDFLVGKLTGICVTDHTMASGTLLYDIHQNCWSASLLEHTGISERLLPELRWAGEAVGTVLPDIASRLGLRSDCVVAVGAQDQRCASLSAGLTQNTATISLGTAGAIGVLREHARTDGDLRIGWSAYIRPDACVNEGVINTAAVSLRWLRDLMYPGCGYDSIDREAEAAQSKPPALFFYPYLTGPSNPYNYPESQGSFIGASLGTTRGDFALAVMEGVAYQIRSMLEAMRALDGGMSLVLFGGGAKSALWCQIIADVTGLCIQVPRVAEAAGAGAAILAGIGTGAFPRDNPPSLGIETSYLPGERTYLYAGAYTRYREIERRLWAHESV